MLYEEQLIQQTENDNHKITYVGRDKCDRDIAEYTKAIEINPKNICAYINRGNTFRNLKEYDSAIADYNKAIEIDPYFFGAYCERGCVYLDMGDYDRAETEFNQSIKLAPKYDTAYYHRGRLYRQKGDYNRAITDFDKAIEIDPNFSSAPVYCSRGNTYSDIGNDNHAIADYSRAIEIDPKCALAYVFRGVTYVSRKDYHLAIVDFNKAIEINPEDANAYIFRGIAYTSRNDDHLAIVDFNKAIEIDPEYANAYNSRGISYAKIGEFEKAIESFTKAIENKANNAIGYTDRGNCFAQIGKYTLAIEDYNNAIEIDPKCSFAYNNRGICFSETGNFPLAIADFDRAIEIAPKEASVHYNRGIEYYKKRDNSSTAMGAYVNALEFFPQEKRFIEGFLRAIENEKNITDEINELLKKSPSNSVQLVKEIFCTIDDTNDRLKYIRLIRAVNDLLEQLEKAKPKETYYQYVKGDSFIKKIGETPVLWLTPACYQNDPGEGKCVFDFFYSQFQAGSLMKIFEELTEKDSKARQVPKNIKESDETSLGIPIAFIRSFSECEDELVMWNSSYADNGTGTSLGIPFCKLKDATARPEFQLIQSGEDQKNEKNLISIKQLYFAKVLYLSHSKETESAQKDKENPQDDRVYLVGVKRALDNFIDENQEITVNVEFFKKFLPRIFLPIAHLIKSADYKHEKEWRLLYYTPIKKEMPFIKRDPLRIETEEILFKDKKAKDVIWLGPNFGKYLELEKMKIQHLFEYDGIADCVKIETSTKNFRG